MMTDTQFAQIALLLTTIVGFVYTAWREQRAHRWAREERLEASAAAAAVRRAEIDDVINRAAAEAQATRLRTEALAEELQGKAAMLAMQIKLETDKTVNTLSTSIATATGAAQQAFTEANHVNQKIENLNARMLGAADELNQTGRLLAAPRKKTRKAKRRPR